MASWLQMAARCRQWRVETVRGIGQKAAVTSNPPAFAEALNRGRRKAVKHRAGGRAEREWKRAGVSQASAGKPTKYRSEKSRNAWRSDHARDEKIFRFINDELRSGQPVRLTSIGAHTVKSAKKNLLEARELKTRIIPEVGLPHWDHASPRLKTLGWGLASDQMNATPVNLRLGSEVIAAAHRDKRGVSRHLQDRLARFLRYYLPGQEAPFWFACEQGVFEDLHLHGAIVIPAGMEAQIKQALLATGGTWTSRPRQLRFSPRSNLVKWIGYATKWLYSSRAKAARARPQAARDAVPDMTLICASNSFLLAASQPMRRAAKAAYQRIRKDRKAIYP